MIPREDGTRRGATALGILLLVVIGGAAFVCGVLGFGLYYPSDKGWLFLGVGIVISVICGVLQVIIFRLTSPDRKRRK